MTITQQLDDDLDFTTFDFEGFGFGDQTYSVVGTQSFFETRIDLRDTHGVFLDVAGNLDVNTGLLTFTFTSLDPTTFDLPLDPIVGFLPPNKTAPEGEGFIRYRVKHDPGLISGTRIDARASIVFDTNAADRNAGHRQHDRRPRADQPGGPAAGRSESARVSGNLARA